MISSPYPSARRESTDYTQIDLRPIEPSGELSDVDQSEVVHDEAQIGSDPVQAEEDQTLRNWEEAQTRISCLVQKITRWQEALRGLQTDLQESQETFAQLREEWVQMIASNYPIQSALERIAAEARK